MPAPSLFRAAAAALVLTLAGASGAAAGHRGHAPLPREDGAPAMHRFHAEHHRMRHGEVMHHRHGMHHSGMHRRHHALHRFHREHPRREVEHRRALGERALFARPRRHLGYVHRHHFGYRARAFFPRPAYHGPGWRQGHVPAYYPYSHGYGFRSYRYYPVLASGTVAGGSVYAPLYNRPAGIPGCDCY